MKWVSPGFVEGSPSGLWRRLGKAVYRQRYRGFESLSLRHIEKSAEVQVFIVPANCPCYPCRMHTLEALPPLVGIPDQHPNGLAVLQQTEAGNPQLAELRLPTRTLSESVPSLGGEAAFAGALPNISGGAEDSGQSSRRERFFRSRFGKTVVGAGTAALTALGLASFDAAPAQAVTTMVAKVYGTGSDGLILHNSSPTGSREEVTPEHTRFDVSCWTTGPNVDGYNAWLIGTSEATGDSGAASNAYLYTNSVAGPNEISALETQGVPECGSGDTQSNSGSFTGVSNNPNNGTISVPSNIGAAPWNYSTSSQHDLVDHVAWTQNPSGNGHTLQVYMTGKGKDDSRYDPNHAFAEAAADANLSPSSPLWGTLQDQFDCHAEVVATVDYGKPSWNLDDWRPDLGVAGDINAGCNPGGTTNLIQDAGL